jgi:RHS repeat-associated protein
MRNVVESRHFLTVGGRAIGVLVSEGALNATATTPPAIASIALTKVEYWSQDHLGSLVATTDHAGTVTARYSYDPFGKRRATSGAYDANGTIVGDWSTVVDNGTARGFTGHEHLDDIGLIQMNGRIFEPTLAVFLQADPHVTNPDDLQNYHRYAYCLNNPMGCTDPSGFDPETGGADATVTIVAQKPLGAFLNWLSGVGASIGAAMTSKSGGLLGPAMHTSRRRQAAILRDRCRSRPTGNWHSPLRQKP